MRIHLTDWTPLSHQTHQTDWTPLSHVTHWTHQTDWTPLSHVTHRTHLTQIARASESTTTTPHQLAGSQELLSALWFFGKVPTLPYR